MGRVYLMKLIVAATLMVGCESKIDVSIEPTPINVVSEIRGTGRQAGQGDLATISYEVMLPGGKELMNHSKFTFHVDTENPTIIQGLNDAVVGMRIGGSRTINCPPHLHWGRAGTGDGQVPPNTDLRIHVKLLAIR